MVTYPVRTCRWTRKDYHRLGELGLLKDKEPVELIGGELIVAEPQGRPHTASVTLTAQALSHVFGGTAWHVRVQLPVEIEDDSEPEPDVQVLPGSPRDYLHDEPEHPVLVVEVSDSMLAFDRRHKGSLYARAAIPDYWIVNLVDRVLEIHRDPQADAAAYFGWRYASVTIHRADDVVAPLARPEARIRVADLLP